MKRKNQVLGIGLCLLMATLLLFSCASISHLSVKYMLPPASEQLKGKRVCLGYEDARTDKNILAEGARREFKNFSENITFSVARHGETGFKIGAFEVTEVVKDGFKRRAQITGVEIVPEPCPGEPEVRIVLIAFFLDLVGRDWVATMNYEARLLKDGELLSKQSINGQVKKVKIVGRGGADDAMGEVFTDTVNKLDVYRLFEQGHLLES